MSSELYVDLDLALRTIEFVITKLSPGDGMRELLLHAADDITEAAGRGRAYGPQKEFVGKFSPGDRVLFITQGFAGGNQAERVGLRPIMEDGVVGRAGVVRARPVKTPPAGLTRFEDRVWFFTASLPVTVANKVDGDMHVDLGLEIRQVYHLKGEHWSTWHETTEGEGGRFTAILTIFPDDRAFDFSARETACTR